MSPDKLKEKSEKKPKSQATTTQRNQRLRAQAATKQPSLSTIVPVKGRRTNGKLDVRGRGSHSDRPISTQIYQQSPQSGDRDTNNRLLSVRQTALTRSRAEKTSGSDPRPRVDSAKPTATEALPFKPRRSTRIAEAERKKYAPAASVNIRQSSLRPKSVAKPAARQQGGLSSVGAAATNSAQGKTSLARPRQRAATKGPRSRLPRRGPNVVNAAEASQLTASRHTKPPQVRDRAVADRRLKRQEEDEVTNWLSHLSAGDPSEPPQVPRDYLSQMSRPVNDTDGRRESSSSITNDSNNSSVVHGETRSGRTGTTVRGKTKTLADRVRLNQHYIQTYSSPDPGLDDLNLSTRLESPIQQLSLLYFQSYLDLFEEKYTAMKTLLPEHSHTNDFSEIEAHQMYESSLQDLIDWRPPGVLFRPWAGVTDRQFRLDQLHCADSNEADFQRTVMMLLVNRYDFQNYFDFSCEELWSTGDYRLPCVQQAGKAIPAPKPDLMICFKGEAIEPDQTFRSNIPEILAPCLYPGTNRDLTKMLPFFFIEVKRGDSSLKGGFERNLNSASQALYNIYQLMKNYPDLVEEFFKKVRVFTLDANVSDMNLRIHRAERSPKQSGVLNYRFYELKRPKDYERIIACHLVRSVLLHYALVELLPIMTKVFQRITSQDSGLPSSAPSTQGTKRKQQNEKQPDLQDVDEPMELTQGNDGGEGSQTPRNQRSPTALTGSFGSQLELNKEPAAQPLRKRTRKTKATA